MLFFTPALDGGEMLASRTDRFTVREKYRGTYSVGGWMGPRAGLADNGELKILDPIGTRNLTHADCAAVALLIKWVLGATHPEEGAG
jgi:hypothetical protein